MKKKNAFTYSVFHHISLRCLASNKLCSKEMLMCTYIVGFGKKGRICTKVFSTVAKKPKKFSVSRQSYVGGSGLGKVDLLPPPHPSPSCCPL